MGVCVSRFATRKGEPITSATDAANNQLTSQLATANSPYILIVGPVDRIREARAGLKQDYACHFQVECKTDPPQVVCVNISLIFQIGDVVCIVTSRRAFRDVHLREDQVVWGKEHFHRLGELDHAAVIWTYSPESDLCVVALCKDEAPPWTQSNTHWDFKKVVVQWEPGPYTPSLNSAISNHGRPVGVALYVKTTRGEQRQPFPAELKSKGRLKTKHGAIIQLRNRTDQMRAGDEGALVVDVNGIPIGQFTQNAGSNSCSCQATEPQYLEIALFWHIPLHRAAIQEVQQEESQQQPVEASTMAAKAGLVGAGPSAARQSAEQAFASQGSLRADDSKSDSSKGPETPGFAEQLSSIGNSGEPQFGRHGSRGSFSPAVGHSAENGTPAGERRRPGSAPSQLRGRLIQVAPTPKTDTPSVTQHAPDNTSALPATSRRPSCSESKDPVAAVMTPGGPDTLTARSLVTSQRLPCYNDEDAVVATPTRPDAIRTPSESKHAMESRCSQVTSQQVQPGSPDVVPPSPCITPAPATSTTTTTSAPAQQPDEIRLRHQPSGDSHVPSTTSDTSSVACSEPTACADDCDLPRTVEEFGGESVCSPAPE